ncbi:MAG TPA: DbpA RNA binding domain-containing protein, partial [Cytophagales bacterium]|nr:DbpA RNA binding domain-containing protein [Cytophagales bacterium]
MSINIGTRHRLTEEAFKDFIFTQSGVKTEALDEIHLAMSSTSFTVDARYEAQIVNNLHHKKHFHQRISVERV